MSKPWLKFYPRDWRGDQALRSVSLTARGLWIDMITIMYEANPYGHLIIGAKPVSGADLARLVGASEEEVQALLVELLEARVARKTRGGVIYSKRMIADDEKAKRGRRDKLEGLGKLKEKAGPSRVASRDPSPQKPEARGRLEGDSTPSNPTDRREGFLKIEGGRSDAQLTLSERIALIQGGKR